MEGQGPMSGITSSSSLADLPGDIFVQIIENLEAWDIIRCQLVSKTWRDVFSDPEFLRIAIRRYQHAKEVRQLASDESTPAARQAIFQYSTIFNKIACRYFHLTHGKARSIQKYKTAIPARVRLTNWLPVSPFEYHESQPGGRLYHLNPLEPCEIHETRPGERIHLFKHSFWSYEDGLLVFAPGKPLQFGYDGHANSNQNGSANFAIMVLDLESQHRYQVPFDIVGRVVRNFRLNDRTLIIEWAEADAYHALNDLEYVHRHFASCYDVQKLPKSAGASCCTWTVTFRSEWKLHFLGLPLNSRDRFFSTHTKNHYAIYLWQPNRSMYTGDEEQPIECLHIWDITQPRQYRPSQDPGGKNQPGDVSGGPHIISRLNYRQLGYYCIRQQSSPGLMKLYLDSEQLTITVRETACISGQGYFDPAERLWCTTSTTILFRGEGPHLRRSWDGNLPPYRGNCSMESSNVLDSETWFLPIMDVVDEKADVRFSLAESVFTGRDVHNTPFVRIRALGKMATLDESTTMQIAYMGKIAGDEQFLLGQNESQEIVVLRFD